MVYPTLRLGDRGPDVTELQEYLGTCPVTGIFDENTLLAVREFQKMNNLTIDGIATTEIRNMKNPPEYISYVVKTGDSLWLIAQKSGRAVSEIREYNHLQSDILYIGQELKIPKR